MLSTFTDAYKKTQDVIKTQSFNKDWDNFIKKNIKALLGDSGLNFAMSSSLERLQRDIQYPNRVAAFFGICKYSGNKESTAILEIANSGVTNNLQDRTAALKFLRHLYFKSKRGEQTIWICSLPKTFAKWPYDEFNGLVKLPLTSKLSETDEIFSSENMTKMCVGTQDALKWCQKVLISLNSVKANKKDKKSLDLVKKWFADENTDATELDAIVDKLIAGFKKISNVCNSNKLVFSDDPVDRSTQPNLWKTTYALVRTEALDVIYVEKVLLGRSGTKLEWSITIVHELSHREVNTKDHFYSDSGLKPNSASFPSSKAIENADNWGFFAADLNNELTKGKINTVLKAP